ncbi:signal peptidase II [Sporolactobacillus sp. CPB3-1]|uniref:Lipoprotein signal peptidase n=1 Tax=Sporolactobacillus mangiferae TaxID=2940498 RepID=A0ABT0M7T5_9BACL|nr:signal peptidase II [Sporolactobacillus mangiferae]MCL1630927.1 signal peptidase II [Sporolactobacillus mangiferae]
MVYYGLAVIILLIDQFSKWLIVHNMYLGQSIAIIPSFFYLTSIRNNGAAWSILEGQMLFFFVITIAVLAVVIFYMQRLGRKQPFLGVSLGLIIGGTLGNFMDRLFRGEVVDFIQFYIFRYHFPVFNLADSSLFIGVVLLIMYLFRDGKKER